MLQAYYLVESLRFMVVNCLMLGLKSLTTGICKQIDEGLKEGFSESEVIRTVIKVTKPGNFREMLTNKDDLTVDGVETVPQISHQGEK